MANEFTFGPTTSGLTLYADVSLGGLSPFQVAMAEAGSSGVYSGTQPNGKAAGVYTWVVRRRLGSSPAPTTDPQLSYPAALAWDGLAEVGSPDLIITVADLRRLCGIDSTDTTQDAALQTVLDAEQLVIEYQIDPRQLTASATDPGLSATLTLGVSEILAGRYLQQQARSPGALDDFKVGPITVSASRQVSSLALAQQLGQHGALRLAPYGRAAGSLPIGPQSATSAAQAAATLPVSDLLPSPPASDGAAASTSALGLFGSLQGAALGTDDGEPPSEFAAGYVSFNDPNALGDT